VLLPACKAKSSLSPQEQLAAGWQDYRDSDFEKALTVFQNLQATQPLGSDLWLQALYGEASCWSQRRSDRDTGKAVTLYKTLLKEAPRSFLAPWAALDIVRTGHLAPADQKLDYPQLARDYANVYETYPDTKAGEDAFLFKSYLQTYMANPGQAAKTLAEMEAFLRTHPNTPYLSTVYKLMAECYRRTGDEKRRIDLMVKSVKNREVDPETPFFELSTSYWDIAYAAEFEAGEFDVAREYYRQLIKEFPNDDRIFACYQALDRMDAIEADLRAGRSLPAKWLAKPAQ
jgi:tetratricopeptide (TPR) repeat protein